MLSPHFLLPAAATVWLGAIFAAPYAREQGHWAAPFIYYFFHQICHQIPERSFFWAGHSLAVCQRCLGLYLGFWIGLICIPLLTAPVKWLLKNPRCVAYFFVPLGIDWATGGTAFSRSLTGLLAGLPVSVLLWEAGSDLETL
ncbi:MAG: DUF2085 domain-containing protein [Acidobacteriota bacterium]